MKKILTVLCSFLTFSNYFSQGDCPPTPVCANTTGTQTSGSISELTPSTDGCLFGEAPRTSWLSICFSSNGIFKFAITPSGGQNNDIDFAVWGPNSPCPPTGAPIRCSYAPVTGGSKVTGVNSLNNSPQTDNSEGVLGNQWVQDLNVLNGQCYVICISNYGGGNNNWTLNFNGTTASMICSALPIELVDFYGDNRDKINQLTWVTASEINNDYFIVENSIDGYVWNAVGIVKGVGNTSTTSVYNFNHEKYKDSINYYRLKQVDFDGQNETFKVIVIDNRIESKELIKVVNFLGQTVTNTDKGLFIEIYSDGTTRKISRD